MNAATARFLVVDDDEVFRTRLARALSKRGFEATAAADVAGALRAARENLPDFAVMDLRMPGSSGLEGIKNLKEINPQMEIVVLTGYGSIATAVEAMRLGARNYLSKPADVEEILGAFAGNPDRAAEFKGEDDFRVPSLARAEWEHINRVLTDCEGNISKAAKVLGMHRRSLQRKLGKYPVAN